MEVRVLLRQARHPVPRRQARQKGGNPRQENHHNAGEVGRGGAQEVGRGWQGPADVEEDVWRGEGEGRSAAALRGRGLLRGEQEQKTSRSQLIFNCLV